MTSSAPQTDRRPGRRTQQERSGETRSRILDAAIDCVAEEGFARTQLSRIAERAGVSVGAIQHQFGDKDAVLAEVVERGFDELVTEVARLPVSSAGLEERVSLLVNTLWDRYVLPPSRAALEILLQMRADPEFLARSVPYLAKIRGAIDRMWMGLFWEADATRAQHIRAQRLLFTTLNGLAMEAILIPAMPDTTKDLETLTRGILRVLEPEA